MTGGNNHAKQIVIEEAEDLAKDLQNGHAGDLERIGKLTALIVKMIKPLYMNEFVTIQQCIQMHSKTNSIKVGRIKLGPLEISGPVTRTLMVNAIPLIYCIGITFLLGKAKSWW